MPDLQEELIERANNRVMMMRQQVVRALAEAHDELMAVPARERSVLDGRTRGRIYPLGSQRQVEFSIHDYETVSELSADASTQKEMLARAAHLRAFNEALKRSRHDDRPWLAAMSVTTAEVVRPDALPDLKDTQEWGMMQRASLEATVSCMPPDPKNWAAADGEGLRRVEDLDADVGWWMSVDRPPESESEVSSADGWTGHLLREAVGARLKDSCERTDTDWLRKDEAFTKAHEFDTRWFMEWTGIPEGADPEQEEYIEVPASDVLDATSDWWALRNGIPAAIDSFPAPNESAQQLPDVRVEFARERWASIRNFPTVAGVNASPGSSPDNVSVMLGAQQCLELKEAADLQKWHDISLTENARDRLLENDDYNPEREDSVREFETLERESRADYDEVAKAVAGAKPVTGKVAPLHHEISPYMQEPATPSPSASADLNR